MATDDDILPPATPSGADGVTTVSLEPTRRENATESTSRQTEPGTVPDSACELGTAGEIAGENAKMPELATKEVVESQRDARISSGSQGTTSKQVQAQEPAPTTSENVRLLPEEEAALQKNAPPTGGNTTGGSTTVNNSSTTVNHSTVNVMEVQHGSFAAPTLAAARVSMTLLDLRGDDSHLDCLPYARTYASRPRNALLVVRSKFRWLCTLASQALSRAFQREDHTSRCKTATVDDASLPFLQEVVAREQLRLLVLQLAHPRIVDSAIHYASSIQGQGVQVVILVSSDDDNIASISAASNCWSMNSSEELLAACEAGEDIRIQLRQSQSRHDWPVDEQDLAKCLANHIGQGGAAEVMKNLDVKQVSSISRARSLVENAANRQDDGKIDSALLFLVSCLPGIPLDEVNDFMETLLEGQNVPVPSRRSLDDEKSGDKDEDKKEKKAFEDMKAFDYWTRNRRDILRRNGVKPAVGDLGVTHLQFDTPSISEDVKVALDAWDIQSWMESLHQENFLLNHRISAEAAAGLVAETGKLFVGSPRRYNADWLVKQVMTVSKVQNLEGMILFFQNEDIRISSTLYRRLADLCWTVRNERPDLVDQFLDKLCPAGEVRGSMALEIVRRLRSKNDKENVVFDAWVWLSRLLESGSWSIKKEVIRQLLADARGTVVSTWQVLSKISDWTLTSSDAARMTHTQRWSFSFLYTGFQADIDQHFFGDDQAGIPPWPERKELLLRWLTHPAHPGILDWLLARQLIEPAWMDTAVEHGQNVSVDGELCISEMLDYWSFKSSHPNGASHSRAMELIREFRSRLENKPVDRSAPTRPGLRQIWRSFRVFASIWGLFARLASNVDQREKFRKRRDCAYETSTIFQ